MRWLARFYKTSPGSYRPGTIKCSTSLFFSIRKKAYKNTHNTTDIGTLQHKWLSRYHGRELTDNEEAGQLIASMPSDLWSVGPRTWGFVTYLQFLLHWPLVPQFGYHNSGTDQMLKLALKQQSQVCSKLTNSDWNTPILTVPKPSTDKYRMVHDLRKIYSIVVTPPHWSPTLTLHCQHWQLNTNGLPALIWPSFATIHI